MGDQRISFQINSGDNGGIMTPQAVATELLKRFRETLPDKGVHGNEKFYQLVANYLKGQISFGFSVYGNSLWRGEVGELDEVQFVSDALKLAKQHRVIGDGVYKDITYRFDVNSPGEYVVALDGRAVFNIVRAKPVTWANDFSSTTVHDFKEARNGPGKLEHQVNLFSIPEEGDKHHRVDLILSPQGESAEVFTGTYEAIKTFYVGVGAKEIPAAS